MTVKFDKEGFALESGYIKVYVIDDQGIYSHSESQFIFAGCGPSANSVLIEPKPAKQDYAVQYVDGEWQYTEDHRGKTYYDTATGTATEITAIGKIPENLTALKPESDLCQWDGEKWTECPDKKAAKQAAAQEQMRAQINALRDSKNAGGVYVEALGKWLDSDSAAQGKLLGLKAVIDLTGELSVDWTAADNSIISNFDKAALTAAIAAIVATENANHINANKHKAAMMELDDPTTYDYSTGWTQTYADYLAAQSAEDKHD